MFSPGPVHFFAGASEGAASKPITIRIQLCFTGQVPVNCFYDRRPPYVRVAFVQAGGAPMGVQAFRYSDVDLVIDPGASSQYIQDRPGHACGPFEGYVRS